MFLVVVIVGFSLTACKIRGPENTESKGGLGSELVQLGTKGDLAEVTKLASKSNKTHDDFQELAKIVGRGGKNADKVINSFGKAVAGSRNSFLAITDEMVSLHRNGIPLPDSLLKRLTNQADEVTQKISESTALMLNLPQTIPLRQRKEIFSRLHGSGITKTNLGQLESFERMIDQLDAMTTKKLLTAISTSYVEIADHVHYFGRTLFPSVAGGVSKLARLESLIVTAGSQPQVVGAVASSILGDIKVMGGIAELEKCCPASLVSLQFALQNFARSNHILKQSAALQNEVRSELVSLTEIVRKSEIDALDLNL